MTFHDFMYGGGPSIVIGIMILILIVRMIVKEKASLVAIARLNGPAVLIAVCLYMFTRGVPHDTTYLLGAMFGAFLIVGEVGRRVDARMKARDAKESGGSTS